LLPADRAEVDRLTSTLDKTVIDRDDQIRDDAAVIELLTIHVPVYTFANNHFAGFAPDTIKRLLAALDRKDRKDRKEFTHETLDAPSAEG
jgi:hypothetical protein